MMNISFKSFVFGTFIGAVSLLSVSCDSDKSYSDYVKDQKGDISSFIKKHNISVVSSRPDSSTHWLNADGDSVYYHYSDGLYFHLIEKGDTTSLAPNVGNLVYIRYVGKTLDGEIVYNCLSSVSANPQNFRILSSPSSDNTFGEGFQKAVRNLYAGGHCTCIVPFQIGNGYNNTISGSTVSDAGDYVPMFYEIWVVYIE